jgi:hypothetical protein
MGDLCEGINVTLEATPQKVVKGKRELMYLECSINYNAKEAFDSLIFCEANYEQLRHLRCLFLCFEVVSGLKNNLGKIELVPVGDVVDVEALASILGCRAASLLMKVFGSFLGSFLYGYFYL